MTAASAAHLLGILTRLPSVTRPRTDKDVLLAEAAAAIRDLLDVVGELERAVEDDVPADCGCGAQMEIAPVLGHRPGCKDVPRPVDDGPLPRESSHAVQGHAPLDHVRFTEPGRIRTAGAVLARWPSVQAPQCDCLIEGHGPRIGGAVLGCQKHDPQPGVRREGMGAQGEPAALPGANTLPPRTDVPRPVEVPWQENGSAAVPSSGPGRTPPRWATAPSITGPGHLNGHALRPPECPQCPEGTRLLLNGAPHCPSCGWTEPFHVAAAEGGDPA